MTNTDAQKLIEKIIDDLKRNGIVTNTLVEDLKKLRPYAVAEKRPVVAKTIRLTYEHIEEFDTFAVSLPNDEEDIVDEETGEVLSAGEVESGTPTENLLYLLILIQREEHKRNKQELRFFNEELKEYAEEYSEN